METKVAIALAAIWLPTFTALSRALAPQLQYSLLARLLDERRQHPGLTRTEVSP